ncbi:MAG: hypothetical protein Q9194_001974 [Teloschistes cf. exilis]
MVERKRSLRWKKQPDAGMDEPPGLSNDAIRFLPLPVNPQAIGASKDVKHPHAGSSYEHIILPAASQQTHTTRTLSPLNVPQPPEVMIGVALGSPGHSPLPSLPPEEASWTCTSPDQTTQASNQSQHRDTSRPKGSRWRTLGGLLSKRYDSGQYLAAASHKSDHGLPATAPHDSYYQVQKSHLSTTDPNVKAFTTSQNSNNSPGECIGPAHLPVAENREKKNVLRKTSLRRHHFARRKPTEAEVSSMPAAKNISGLHQASPRSAAMELRKGQNGIQANPLGGSLLQVEIPNIELDRYSVMFSSLLEPTEQSSVRTRQPSRQRQPSLLARRQVHLQGLDTTERPIIERPWMYDELSSRNRAASPKRASSPTRSPSLSLFPPSPPAHGRKSNRNARESSPLHRSATTPVAVSPSKAKFEFFDKADSRSDQVILIVHTPSEPEESRRGSAIEYFHSPQSLPQPSGPTTEPSQKATTNARVPSFSRPSNPSKPSSDIYDKAAEISIARQISISRQQRQLLVPTVPTKVVPPPVQPTIVNAPCHGSRERQSHRVVLEDA